MADGSWHMARFTQSDKFSLSTKLTIGHWLKAIVEFGKDTEFFDTGKKKSRFLTYDYFLYFYFVFN
jgi:hypothetical protein